MDRDSLKIAVDIAKTKLAFFSAVAGGAWLKLDFKLTFLSGIMLIVFVASLVGVVRNLLLLGKYERSLENE